MTTIERMDIENLSLNKKEVEFEKSKENKILSDLKNNIELQDVMDKQEKINESFHKLTTLACMDERVSIDGQEQGKIGIAGSLCLTSEEEIERFVKKYRGEIKVVTSHDDCGAADIAFGEDSSHRSQDFAAKLAERLSAEYQHIKKDEMRGEVHDARALIIDDTEMFNPSKIDEMPEHYTLSAAGFGFGHDYIKKEIEAALKIAFSDHGFGNLLTEENPFYIFVCVKEDENQEIRIGELKKIADQASEQYGQKVQIKSFFHKINKIN